LVFAVSVGAATVFEASAKADIAGQTARAAIQDGDARQRIAEFEAAAELIERSWARPVAWHGGANETLSWIYGRLAGETGADPTALGNSAEAAARAVALAPIQPASWARLASLAERGAPSPCAVEQCLERSWMAVRFVDTQTDCARLRMAHAHGMLSPYDERIGWFARKALHQADVESCLAFLPPQELFHALMLFTIQDAIWQEDRE
jgi:hypothetical protein